MSRQLGERKANHVLDAGAQAVFTGNVGCLLQIGRYLRAQQPDWWEAHPVDALWASYSGELPDVLRSIAERHRVSFSNP
jgi:glycolate oxidase iron-sulfur subunit